MWRRGHNQPLQRTGRASRSQAFDSASGARPATERRSVIALGAALGLEDTNSIDIVSNALPGDDCKIVLYAIDDGTTTDELRRYQLLIEKLRAYVDHVASAEFRSSHPNVGFGDVLVRVLCKTPPNDVMLDVQAVRPKGDAHNRLKVVFADLDSFLAALKSG